MLLPTRVGTSPSKMCILHPDQSPHPPIWVGGPSDAALRRAVRYGDAWHPIRISMNWFKNTGIPRLRETAEKLERPVPALCPRIKLRLTDEPLPDDSRLVGEGNLKQVHHDMAELEELGCQYVLLDTFNDDLEAVGITKPRGECWRLWLRRCWTWQIKPYAEALH